MADCTYATAVTHNKDTVSNQNAAQERPCSRWQRRMSKLGYIVWYSSIDPTSGSLDPVIM